MGYRDDPKTKWKFWDGRCARKDGKPITNCPFKKDCPSKRAWELGWKVEDDKLSPRQVTEKEWNRRMLKEKGELPREQHFCSTWKADECVCQGTCGCHYQGSIRKHRVSLIRMDHICSYYLPRDHWVVVVHGIIPTDVWNTHHRCEACEKALAEGKPAFREGEILTIKQVVEEYEKGRRCFGDESRQWRHLWT